VSGVDYALSGCSFNLDIHLIRTYSCCSTVARYKCHCTPGMGACISLTAWSQGYVRHHLNSYCIHLVSARHHVWLQGTAKSPSGVHCGVRTGRTTLALSCPSLRNLGRPTVPGRPTGGLTSLVVCSASSVPFIPSVSLLSYSQHLSRYMGSACSQCSSQYEVSAFHLICKVGTFHPGVRSVPFSLYSSGYKATAFHPLLGQHCFFPVGPGIWLVHFVWYYVGTISLVFIPVSPGS